MAGSASYEDGRVAGADGQATLDGSALSTAAMGDAQQSRHHAEPDVEVFVSANPRVEFSRAAGMIDLRRAAGIWHFAIAVDPPH